MRKTLMVAVLALVLAGCTNTEKTNEDAYPREAEENFVDNCMSSAKRAQPSADDRQLRARCQCVVDKLEERIPYARDGADNDFKEADAKAREGQTLPTGLQDDFDQATADCVQDR